MTVPDIHESYALLSLVGLALLFLFPVAKHFTSPADRSRYYAMQAITAVAAILGAKFAVLVGDELWPVRPFHDWAALLFSGKSIVGALLFGFLVVEIAKPLMRYDIPPNDRFAIVLPISIGIGRVGCLLAGCCRGLPYDGPLAVVYADGISRYPTQAFETVFQFAAGFTLFQLWKRQLLFGRLFAAYLVAYGVFRFATEFVRDTPKAYAGMSGYQWMCLAMILSGSVALVVRTRRQPESWNRWKAPREAR